MISIVFFSHCDFIFDFFIIILLIFEKLFVSLQNEKEYLSVAMHEPAA